MDKISLLQSNLPLIRKCAGWTAAELGDKIGVKRQTISTIEQGEKKYKMTQMQYLAIRKVLDDEIKESKDDTQMLWLVLDSLVDHPDNYTPEEAQEILSKANLLAPALVKKPEERKTASRAMNALLLASGVVASAALIAFLGKKNDR